MIYVRKTKIAFLLLTRCMKMVAYLRISTGSRDLANQKLAILDYARQNRFAINRFVKAQASSRKGGTKGVSRSCSVNWPWGTV